MAAKASKGKSKALDRRDVVRMLLAKRGELLVIAGLVIGLLPVGVLHR